MPWRVSDHSRGCLSERLGCAAAAPEGEEMIDPLSWGRGRGEEHGEAGTSTRGTCAQDVRSNHWATPILQEENRR